MSTADEVSIALEEVTGALPGGGEVRRGQRSMALEIAEAIDTEHHLVIQAGTGTGKTLAYLIPAILSGRRTVIATWSKALQDQMERSDLPMLVNHLDRIFSHAVLKGWDNYVCHERLDQIRAPGRQQALDGLADGSDDTQVDSILEWADTSVSGDRADLPFEPTPATWSSVSVGTDDCIGLAECPFAAECRPARARQRARDADICITNHHLYAIDVALNGMLLDHPDNPHELVIFDEAHQLEEVFTASFGFQLTAGRFRWLARLARPALKQADLAAGLDDAVTRFSTWLADNPDRRLVADACSDLDPVLDLAETRIDRVLVAARKAVRDIDQNNDDPGTQRERRRLTRLVNAGSTLIGDIRFARELLRKLGEHTSAGQTVVGDNHLAWVERSGTRMVLRVAPIEVGPRLASDLWPLRTAVLTSATLPINLPARLALPEPDTSTVDSPFDYETQSLLYCPTHIPSPSEDEPGWSAAMLTELEFLIRAGGGRTLALFTSWRRLQTAATAIRPLVPYRILEQGDLPARTLLEEFAADESSCLFATRSFWQGIDVPGPSLGLVVIDRIPFPRPDEHLTRAWRDRAGLDGWGAVDLPLGALRLAQGVGRLIRSRTDHGVAAVLDPRLSVARYSGALLTALPPMRRTSDPEEAATFLGSLFS
jgi:ATP-dependent DNA helicase DinG